MPPPVTQSDEEPIAAGGRQVLPEETYMVLKEMQSILVTVVGQPRKRSGLSTGGFALGASNAGETPGVAGGTPAPLPEQFSFVPPPVTQSDEEPIAAGGWYF